MLIRRHRGAAAVGALGTVIVIAHIVLAVAIGLTASQWFSGAVIGLVLVVAAGVHTVLASRRRDSVAR